MRLLVLYSRDGVRTVLKWSYKVARVWGIPIRVHISLIVLLALIAANFARKGWESVAFVIAFEVCYFTSIAFHELGHSFVAMRKGCRVREITLLMFGGVAQMEKIPQKPRDEFLMAIAGPFVSLSIGVPAALAGGYFYVVRQHALAAFPFLLGSVNIVLALFNLVPAFPMDGGRILRAALTPRLGRLKATRIASYLGKMLALCFLGFAVYRIRRNMDGFVLLVIAVFVFYAAGREYRLVLAEEMARRDDRDRTRLEAPLSQAPDADYIDSTGLTPAEVEEAILKIVRARTSNGKGHRPPA